MNRPTSATILTSGRLLLHFTKHDVELQFLVFPCCDDGIRMIAFPHAREHPNFCPFCGAPAPFHHRGEKQT